MEKSSSKSGNRLLLILTAAAVVAAGVVFLVGRERLHRGTPERAAAFGGWRYDRQDQQHAAAALVKAGLTDYTWEDDHLLVPATRRGEYERILSESGAVPQKPSALKQEELDALSAFESENRTKLRDLYSSARQLEKTLESFRQIESASVGPHARREQSGLYPKTVVTAAISVTPKEGCIITPELVSSITMAARHHLGITDNGDVSIIDTVSGRSWLGSEGGIGRLGDTAARVEQTRLESILCDRLREALGYIPNVRVTTAVELEAAEGDSERSGTSPAAETRRPIGLEFRDEDISISESTSGTVYVPRTVAAAVAVPESYVRHLADAEAAAGERDGSLFDAKKEEILTQVRSTAEAMLVPTAEAAEEIARRVEVSLYTDLSDEERVYRPTAEPEAAPEGFGFDTEQLGEEISAAEKTLAVQIQKVMTKPWTGFVLAFIAFATGLVIRSIFTPHGTATKEETNTKTENAEATGNTSAESIPLPEIDASLPVHTESSAPQNEPPARSEQEDMATSRLNEILNELEDDDFGFDTDDETLDAADETIAPTGPATGRTPFFPAEMKDGSPIDVRIDSDRYETDGPHFPVHGPEIDSEQEIYDDFSRRLDFEEKSCDPPREERFAFLSGLDSTELRALLDKQRPQTVALIARCASAENRSRVLGVLRNRLRAEVEKRMCNSDEPDRKVVAAVEASLRESLDSAGKTSA